MKKQDFKEQIYNVGFLKIAESSLKPAEAAGEDKMFSRKEAVRFAKTSNPTWNLEDAVRIAKKIGLNFKKVDFTVNDFLVGLGVENEHFDDKQTRVGKFSESIVGRIAWRHLKENSKYYTRLKD